MTFRFISAVCVTLAVLLSVPTFADTNGKDFPKNIIMVVGDGMGPAYTTAYRYFNDTDLSDGIERTIFDKILVGSASTYPAEESGLITDSAAGATALSTGIKTYNGAIALDTDRQPLNTVLREAKRMGMRTGLAVTSQIVHATPAAYVTHNESRQNYNEIADHFFDDKINGEFVVDVMLGGGTSYFERDDRDIIAQFIDEGYQYTDSYNKLATYPKQEKLIGLFAPVGLPWSLDDKRHHRLSYLTEHAITHLENDDGFFLLIEASQVDWAGHANDIASAMAEMDDLAQTMIMLKSYVENHPDTLVVLTADHSTGGLTLGANGDYRWDPSFIKNMQSSVPHIAENMVLQPDPAVYVSTQLGFSLTEDERILVKSLTKEQTQREREVMLKHILDARTNTGWTTGGHTGVDVPVFAMGSQAYRFAGSQDNTDIGRTLFTLLDTRTSKASKIKKSSKTVSKENNKSDSEVVCSFKKDWHC